MLSFSAGQNRAAKRYRDALRKVNNLLIVIGPVETVDNSGDLNQLNGTTTL